MPVKQPRVSIVLPVFNGERYLEECIQSVMSQQLEDWELIIGDDLSSDRSLEIARQFRDERIRICPTATRLGLFRNLNRLIEQATSPLVRFLCQDDVLEQGCLLADVEYFDSNPEVLMAYCQVTYIDENGSITGLSPDPGPATPLLPDAGPEWLLYYGCIPGSLSTVCVRRKAMEISGLFDETFEVSGDFDLWRRIWMHGPLAILPDRIVRLRRHRQQLSRSPNSSVSFARENRRIRAALLSCIPGERRGRALRYVYLRHNVFDINMAVRCLLDGSMKRCVAIVKAMGPLDFLAGVLSWLLTLNNRIWRPSIPPWIQEVPACWRADLTSRTRTD